MNVSGTTSTGGARPIVTVTLNPAIDRSVWLDGALVPGRTHRARTVLSRFGGKGINVARTAAALAAPVIATGVAGEESADALERELARSGVEARFLRVPAAMRTNLKLIERATGRLTEVNEPGASISQALLAELEAWLFAADPAAPAGWSCDGVLVLSGSLPPGTDPSLYARWTARSPLPTIVDAAGAALRSALAAHPWLVKPNRAEAEELLGWPITDVEEAGAAALDLLALGAQGVILSLGGEGAIAAHQGKWQFIPVVPVPTRGDEPQSSVGAGDAVVAAMAVGLRRWLGEGGGRCQAAAMSTEHFFRLAAWGASVAARHIGGLLPAGRHCDQTDVRVDEKGGEQDVGDTLG